MTANDQQMTTLRDALERSARDQDSLQNRLLTVTRELQGAQTRARGIEAELKAATERAIALTTENKRLRALLSEIVAAEQCARPELKRAILSALRGRQNMQLEAA